MPVRPYDAARTRRTLFDALLEARARHGGNKEILEDADRAPMTFDKLVLGAMVLGRKLANLTQPKEAVGLMLANSAGVIVAFFGLTAFGRTPAMINFTAGPRTILQACEAAKITRIVTAHRFIEQAKLEPLIEILKKRIEIIYLDDLKASITTGEKLRGLVDATLPFMAKGHAAPDDIGVILFTSGTEGAPKGVALSHANIVGNVEQIAGHVDLNPDDVVLNPLPVFHCFGLTGGTLLPLLNGMKAVLFPSPLRTKEIPKMVRDVRATILFATDTFLSGYARAADDGDMASLRFVVCGAERVKDETRQMMLSRFGTPIVEGYGATECAPVLAVNQPDHRNRPGTVGRFLPGVEWRLESVPGIEGGGRLHVKGVNIMSGYIRVDAPGEIQPLAGGWHDTGDIVAIDQEGYVTIRGRLKRFAKIGGEMVSLALVEANASAVWPDAQHCAIAVSDPKKGEQIVLLTEQKDADRNALIAWGKANGVAELTLPRRVVVVDAIPVLGTGKTDYVAAQRMAEGQLAAAA